MKPKETKADVGIVIGRFQTPDLHEAHIDLFQSVINRHSKVIVFLGLSPLKTTVVNPLDFEARKQMILQKFPDVNVLYIKDMRDDVKWTKKLDSQIEDLIGPNQTVLLYGSRDSFINGYKNGKYQTVELEPVSFISATELRKQASIKSKSTADFRIGVIHAVENQYTSCLPTVDVAIIDEERHRILLARKPDEDHYRFVGGFASVNSMSYEDDAKREAAEETGLEVDKPQYIGSCLVNDWRYKRERNKIKTLFFKAKYLFGTPQANDDVKEITWFNIDKDLNYEIVDEHKPLLEMLLKFLNQDTK